LVGVRQELEEKQKPKHNNPPFAKLLSLKQRFLFSANKSR
jgi:hypothetical protein